MRWVKKYFFLAVALFFAALNFNFILKPLNLVTGGNQGLAILLNHVFKVSPSLIILIINVLMLILSYFTLSKRTTIGTIAATFMYPLFVKISSYIPFFELSDKLMVCWAVLAGIVCGITGGVIYRLGFSSGGISVLNVVVNKFFKVKIATVNFIVNASIIIFGYFYFGLMKCIYSMIVISVGSLIIYKFLHKNKEIENNNKF